MEYIINWPADSYKLTELRSGDIVHLSGTIYTARDAAHRRLVDLLDADKDRSGVWRRILHQGFCL